MLAQLGTQLCDPVTWGNKWETDGELSP